MVATLSGAGDHDSDTDDPLASAVSPVGCDGAAVSGGGSTVVDQAPLGALAFSAASTATTRKYHVPTGSGGLVQVVPPAVPTNVDGDGVKPASLDW